MSAEGSVDVWRREEGRLALEAHFAIDTLDLRAATEMKEALKTVLGERFGVAHAVIEIEFAGVAHHDRRVVPDERPAAED